MDMGKMMGKMMGWPRRHNAHKAAYMGGMDMGGMDMGSQTCA